MFYFFQNQFCSRSVVLEMFQLSDSLFPNLHLCSVTDSSYKGFAEFCLGEMQNWHFFVSMFGTLRLRLWNVDTRTHLGTGSYVRNIYKKKFDLKNLSWPYQIKHTVLKLKFLSDDRVFSPQHESSVCMPPSGCHLPSELQVYKEAAGVLRRLIRASWHPHW